MRKRNIISAILMIAITTSIFAGCKPSVPDDGTSASTNTSTSASETEATTTAIQKAPVTLYANFDNEVLNDAPTTLPDDGFYYKAFTSVANSTEDHRSWYYFFTSGDFYGCLYAPKTDLKTYTEITQAEHPNFDDETCELFYNYAINNVKDNEGYIEEYKANYPNLAEYFELGKNKINIHTWGDFAHECLAKEDIELNADGIIPNPALSPQEYYDFEKIDAEVMPEIAALAEAWMEANFMGTPIPDDMTTEDFRTYIDTDAAYAYFASKGILPYQISNDTTRESLQSSGLTKEKSREFFATDKVFINVDFDYANFIMSCTSNLYLKTEDGQEGFYPVRFIIVVKPEKIDGDWSFKLDYASFDQYSKQMDKWGTINAPKACTDLRKYTW